MGEVLVRPRTRLTGTVHLNSEFTPCKHSSGISIGKDESNIYDAIPVTLELYWCEVGRCDPHKTLIEKQNITIEMGEDDGYEPAHFSFLLPHQPHTYDGLLFRRIWYVDAVVLPNTPKVQTATQTFRMMLEPTPDPYQAVGLLGNPFAERGAKQETGDGDHQESGEGVPQSLWLERGHSQPPPAQDSRLVQVLGVKGAGKSSHLKHWQRQAPGPYIYYPAWWPNQRNHWLAWFSQPFHPTTQRQLWSNFGLSKVRAWLHPPPLAPLCYWDEADRMPWVWLWGGLCAARLMRSTVCVGTHRNLQPIARLLGLSVTTIHLQDISAQDIQVWARLRLQAATASAHSIKLSSRASPTITPIAITPAHARDLAAQAAGSWRNVATALHVWLARYIHSNHVQVNTESATSNAKESARQASCEYHD